MQSNLKRIIYVGHARSFDYQKDLYAPIKDSEFYDQFDFIFPHELNSPGEYSKDIILTCDGMIAEVSYPSTGLGLGIELANEPVGNGARPLPH